MGDTMVTNPIFSFGEIQGQAKVTYEDSIGLFVHQEVASGYVSVNHPHTTHG